MPRKPERRRKCPADLIPHASTRAVQLWFLPERNTVRDINLCILRRPGRHPAEDIRDSGRKPAKRISLPIRFALSAWRRGDTGRLLWLTISFRTGETRHCSGIRITGRRCASLVMTGKPGRRTRPRSTGTEKIKKYFFITLTNAL